MADEDNTPDDTSQFETHQDVVELFNEARRVETDNRERATQAHSFIDDVDGQWEQHVLDSSDNKPRYTFDMTGAIVDQVAGEIEQADFSIRVKPAGGDATKDDAKLIDGLIRNIENISGAAKIYSTAGRHMVTAGIDGWRVAQRYVDSDSFEQEIVIDPLSDFANRVWFDPNARLQDKSDAKYCFVIQPMGKKEYEKRFPEGSEQGVGSSICDVTSNSDWGYRPDDIFIGQIYYKKEVKRTLHLLSDGRVVEDGEDYEKIKDELLEAGVTIDESRERPRTVVVSRLFDASDWLIEPEDTVFAWIPVVPTYGNYKINRNKTIYRGVVQKLMDAQRVMNYSLSREIEEGALAPRAKFWMTLKQALGYESTIQTLNTNADPVQFYNADAEAPGIPGTTGGATINPGLRTISMAMGEMFGSIAGLFAANMGNNPGLQSGIAIQSLQNKGDTGTVGYHKSQEIAICHTGRIIENAIPRVYDTKRQLRILEEDGSFDMKVVNDMVLDEDTNTMVRVNDLSSGKYDVTCSSGPSFQNKQQEAVAGMIEVASVDPSIIAIGGDILAKNMTFPGADQLADRKRAQLFDQGLIPIDQMTDEEKTELQAAQAAKQAQGNQPTPDEMIGQAEVMKAQNEKDKTQISVQEKSANIMIAQNRERREDAKFREDVQQGRATFAQDASQNQFEQVMAVQKQQGDTLNTMVNALKAIQEAAGGPVVGPGLVQNVAAQSDIVSDAQADMVEDSGRENEQLERPEPLG